MKPIILLAFANDKGGTGAGYLRGLTAERNAIRDALMKAEENNLCEVVVEPDFTVDRLFDTFQNSNYRDRIAIFHYGGHAESYSLLLETASGAKATAHSEGLVGFLAKQKSLKLVFLNGCTSQNQAQDLVKAGLPAVIGTSEKIQDAVATTLASRFYKGLSSGMAIEKAWTDAIDQVKTEKGTEKAEDLYRESILMAPGEKQFPWELYTGESGALSKAWNLPEAANQPLFGLELPKTYYRKLPLAPFVGIRCYTREEAGIFFGRGQDIRKLHTQLGREQPVILLSGKKGVGKSSLLNAGLAPRIESEYTLSCYDIESKGLQDSLSDALDQVREANSLEKLVPKDKSGLELKIEEIRLMLPSLSGIAKDILDNELQRLIHLAGMERLTFYEQWISIEEKTGRPLVVILDEIPNDPRDWRVFLEILISIFEVKNPPKGKLILGMDEESHAPFVQILQSADFPYAEIFLQPLGWEGLNEAITGITISPITNEFYRLQIENSNANNLPGALTGDLLDGEPTLVAPYLQVILSDMWKAAVLENAQAPFFTLRHYQQGILSGEIMDRFYTQQTAKIKAWNADPMESGLALDLLYLHTSAMGKSSILDIAKRKSTYPDRQEIINSLLSKCKDLFLLTPTRYDGTNLGHNMLASVVTRHYSISLSPGQQAARILNGKTGETAEPGKATWLNEADLETVEKGIKGMRCLTDQEEALLEFSRIKKIKAQRDRKRNRIIRGFLISVVVVFAALAAFQWYRAYQRYLYAKAGELAFNAREELNQDNTVALDIARHAYTALEGNSPPVVMQTLSDIWHTQDAIPFYSANFPHKKKVFTAVYSPDGKYVLTASEDGYVKLWDINGKEILSIPHEIQVTTAVFSPNGQQILTLTLGHVHLFERDGTEIDTNAIPETMTSLDSFSTDGMKIIPRYADDAGTNYASVVSTLRNEIPVVVSSLAANRILGINYGSCRLYDENGIILRDSFSSAVTHAAFSRDGKQFLTLSPDSVLCHITVWNDAGDSLFSFRCKGTEVNAVFSPDGKEILTASNDFTAKRWDISHPFLHRFPHQTLAVNTVDYFPDGNRYLTAAYDSTAKIWDANGKLIDILRHGDVVNSAFFSLDGKYVITASKDSTARIWIPRESNIVVLRHGAEVTSAIFSHDGQTILTSSKDSLVRLWALDGTLLKSFKTTGEVISVIFSPDEKSILTVESDNEATLWSVNGDSLNVFTHPAKMFSAVFSPDGKSLLTSCADSLVRQWSLEGEILRSLRHFEKPKFALFTPDGRSIITGGKMVKIWNNEGIVQDSLLHDEYVSSIKISPDGRQILTTCIDHNAYLWNFAGDLLATYRKHTEKINYGCFIPDGSHILTVSDDGYAIRWRVPQAIFDQLKTTDIYQLSQEEKEEFGIARFKSFSK